MDQKLSLSTHILDTTVGRPADDVPIKLYKLVGGIWVESTGVSKSDKDGRVRDFTRIDGSAIGVYKLRFEIAGYFERLGVDTLYPFVEVSRSRHAESEIEQVNMEF